MDQLYSLSLLGSLVIGGVGIFSSVLTALSRFGKLRAFPKAPVVSLIAGLTSLFLGAISAIVHFRYGHGSGSPEPMSLFQFLTFHKAYWIVAALVVFSFLGLAISSKKVAVPH